MVEVVIDSIRVGLMSQQRVVILREVEAERYLAIWIDPYMAEQITFSLQEVEVARPMTHDLLKNMLRSLDARVVRVEVISLRGDVFYGNIVIEVNGYNLDIDARPSDALALAVRSNVPILISEDVMESAGIVPEDDIDDLDPELERGSEEVGELEEGEERLSVFDDFLENLDVNDEDGEEDKD
ncbi:MAG: bifunctional nuclease family protein [Chloroflexi bacterium]|nr:MAG: bifunctional nuclease family protein [Chloroflexota bacterium]MBL1197273.1 bifunctional nuclease family protein [Chloroflexota bacterium]NOH14568.1 bifunctional nuclease family protein [Chloroflexota bacterium]